MAVIILAGGNISENEWYDNENIIKDLIYNFEKAGIPLEYKSKRIFEKYGFEAFESYYKYPPISQSNDHGDNIWRQIDLIAIPVNAHSGHNIHIGNTKISIDFSFTAECKFSSNRTFFMFADDSPYLLNFPSADFGKSFLPNSLFILNLKDNDDDSFSRIPSTMFIECDTYEKVVEVDISSRKTKKNNYDDCITFGACEQLFNSIVYDKTVYLAECGDIVEQILESNLCKKWITYLYRNKISKYDFVFDHGKINDRIALDFLKNNFSVEDISNINFYHVNYHFPLLIVDNENSSPLYNINLDEANNIKSFENIKYGIYTYTHNKDLYPLNWNIYPESLDVIICDVNYLEDLIESVMNGIYKFAAHLNTTFVEKPYLLAYDMLFNTELINPEIYFDFNE